MKKKLTLTLAMLMASSMAFTGCGNGTSSNGEQPENTAESTAEATDAKEGDDFTLAADQTLRVNLGADPLTLDPQLNSAADGNNVINNSFEGLMREKDGELVPAVAESYTMSEDGLTYTFKLRDSLWSDGKPVTAKDFEFAWKRGADPALASEYMYIFETAGILNAAEIGAGKKPASELGVKAIDDKTLEVKLAAPTAYFINLMSFGTFMPVREDMVDTEGAWAKDPAKAVSNGPFKLSEYKMGDQLVYVKNENYWNAKEVNLQKIVYYMIVDESTAHTKYTSGELDVNEYIPRDEMPTLIAEDATFYVLPKIGTYYYAFNMNNKVLQDVKVRKALSLAINREQIVNEVTKGGETPAYGFVPAGITDDQGNDFSETAGTYNIDPKGNVEEAKKLLAEAGFPDGKGFPEIELLYNTSESHKLIAESIQEMLKQNLGVTIKLTNQEWAVFQETTKANKFESLARRGWIGDYNDPQTMLEIFESANVGQNIGRYNSKAFDAEMDAAAKTMDAERMGHLYKANDILMEDMPIIPIYYYSYPIMFQDTVHDWQVTSISKYWFGDAEMIEAQK